jgi:5-methylcytosine-specific restriction endonuclease McrA
LTHHPFAGRKGSAKRDQFATTLYAQQGGKCRMCSKPIPPSLRGRSGKRAAVVDHLRPWKLVPERSYDLTNLQLICRSCHALCHGIEDAHAGDAEMIAQVKERHGQEW